MGKILFSGTCRVPSLPGSLILNNSKSNGDFKCELKCIMGCEIDLGKPVIPLPCMHFICSDKCAAKLKSKSKSESLRCEACSGVITADQLKEKMVPSKVFIRKVDISDVELICENCVWNRPAAAYCPECPACLCQQCKELHPQTRATHKHVLKEDINEQRVKQLEKLLEDETKCTTHSEETVLTYCKNCDCTVCAKCMPTHNGHKMFNIGNGEKILKEQIDLARKLTGTYDRAVEDIQKKRSEMLTAEWESIAVSIREEMNALCRVILKREQELIREAKERFMKQVSALNMRAKCAQLSKASNQQFVSLAEHVLNNGSTLASTKFLSQYENFAESLNEMHTNVALEYNRFIDKDWHFKLDLAGDAQVRSYLSEYCQLKYSHSPDGANSSSAAPQTATLRTPGKITNGTGKSPSRRIAVKSTASPQATGKVLKTYSRVRNRSSNKKDQPPVPLLPALDNHVTIPMKSENRDTVNSQDGQAKIKATRRKNRQEEEELIVDVDTVEDKKADSSEDSNSDDTVIMDTSALVTVSGLESEKENSKDAGKRALDKTPVLVESKEDAGSKLVEDPSNKSRSDGASPESSYSSVSSDSTEPAVLGKRERKKKSYPGFVDTDETYKSMLKQAAATGSSARMRRKSDSSKPNVPKFTSPPPPPPVQQEPEGSISVESESGQECEVSDGGGSEKSSSSGRRQSLRKRNAKTPTPVTPPQPEPLAKKRRRRSSAASVPFEPASDPHEATVYKVAPMTSIEMPPELCDFPIQGYGKMKINNTDNNDDYCFICMDGGEEIIVCCDFCPKVFHLNCHLPVVKQIPEGDEKWQCNHDRPKETIDKLVAACPDFEGSENGPLNESNGRHFILACKFVMEVYKIPESPTIRWVFPNGYLKIYGQTPFHLKYIRERLCLGRPEPFTGGVKELMLAFKQMFMQAYIYYKDDKKEHFRAAASTCLDEFLKLVDEYYPEHRELFENIPRLEVD